MTARLETIFSRSAESWRGRASTLDRVLHASTETQAVRDEVFKLLAGADFRVDATILEKRKAQPHLHAAAYFYRMAWYLHFKFVAPKIASAGDRLLVTAASLGTKKQQGVFHNAVERVVRQVSPTVTYRVAFWPYASDPCLQIADYCTWAIQRKREGVKSQDVV